MMTCEHRQKTCAQPSVSELRSRYLQGFPARSAAARATVSTRARSRSTRGRDAARTNENFPSFHRALASPRASRASRPITNPPSALAVASRAGRRARTMKPPLRTEPACMGTVWEAPASADSKVSTSCSLSDMIRTREMWRRHRARARRRRFGSAGARGDGRSRSVLVLKAMWDAEKKGWVINENAACAFE